MRVGFDLHVVDGLFQGSRTHVIELFARVAKLCPEIEFVCLLDDTASFLKNYPAFALPNVRLERMAHTGSVRRLMWELPRMQRRLGLDLLHTQYIIPLPSLSKTVVTIHDVLFESHPQYFQPVFRLRSRILMRWAAYQAEHIFTVSEFSKREICERYGVAQERVTVTTNAADRGRFYPGTDGADLVAARGLQSGGYFLTVGRLEPRKNHVTLFKAYAALGQDAPPLVVVGQKDFGFDAMFEVLAQAGLQDKVVFLDNVGDKELPALYRHCLAFAYPSLAEGFGMPPLEAMASGVPVIAANNTALTEVVGDAGALVESTDVAALRNAMQALVTNAQLRIELADKGQKQAEMFSWDEAARRVAAQYRAIAAKDKAP
jgi:glycosyltransferase involved in cell wall biosynthesis